MVWLSGFVPYKQAEAVMARIGKWAISDSSLWRVTQQYGERLLQADQQEPLAAVVDQAEFQQVSMDGGLINIRGEGWKEMKAALVGHVGSRLGVDEPTGQVVECPQTIPTAYIGVLGDVATFEPALQRLVAQHALDQTRHVTVLADGAAWIWRLAEAYLPNSIQIVDWYHACQHLAQAAQALFPDAPARLAAWLTDRKTDLWEGRLRPILHALRQANLADFSAYFQTHASRMRYPTFRNHGWPIGSGAVESEVKQFKARLAGPGMRWSRPAADRMILIRAAVLDGSFDARWSQVVSCATI